MTPLIPKRPTWLWGATTLGAVIILLAGARALFGTTMPTPGDVWGLTFGTLAAVLMLLAGLYPLRRRLMLGPLGTAQDWLQAHIYGASLAAILVPAHTGFRFPHGWFGWLLFALTGWVTVSGLVGVFLQKVLPPLVSRRLQIEMIYERAPEILADLRERARRTVDESSEVIRRFHTSEVEPLLAGLSPSWSSAFVGASTQTTPGAVFDRLDGMVSGTERDRVAELKQIVATKLELDIHYSVQRVLRMWPVLHVPPAIALLATVAAHIVAVWYF